MVILSDTNTDTRKGQRGIRAGYGNMEYETQARVFPACAIFIIVPVYYSKSVSEFVMNGLYFMEKRNQHVRIKKYYLWPNSEQNIIRETCENTFLIFVENLPLRANGNCDLCGLNL